ncbi:DNA polymerase III subunit epsilon [Sphingorhabdus lutea]|uniref:DNA polymerase III subunit epsilon n=1 Tax=Sphingorhabdus lutea TaxID=1913578 RepID=A0A1L3J9G7_9SPHN|nr:DNA polymerase III subunit epsilon [Sphingorhabdus lutea]APG61751.1 DNA polymerase III subunit epsilon [Sphingorhabdus lutea]
MREIIFDTETTGFSPDNGDRMVEIGCVEMIDRVLTGQSFHAYYNPQRTMPAAAEQVHGLSDIFLSDKPLFADGAEELLAFLQDSPLVAHNAPFDFGFINAELSRAGHDIISMDRMVDTIVLAKKKHPGAKMSLDALCTRYGIDRSHRIKHGALLDAELLAQLYIELLGGRQIGLGLNPEITDCDAANDAGQARKISKPTGNIMPIRPFNINAEEEEAHKAFIAKIENAIWHKF